jgi:uncharacterized low-complexity protein
MKSPEGFLQGIRDVPGMSSLLYLSGDTNMSSKNKLVSVAVGAAFAAGLAAPVAMAASNPFALQSLDKGYMVAEHHEGKAAAEGKCGGDKKAAEGKCGGDKKAAEGKCGGDKKAAEGKCGEGKCGAEGKCGHSKTKDGKCGEGKCGGAKKPAEGKCGEGKCGAKK